MAYAFCLLERCPFFVWKSEFMARASANKDFFSSPVHPVLQKSQILSLARVALPCFQSTLLSTKIDDRTTVIPLPSIANLTYFSPYQDKKRTFMVTVSCYTPLPNDSLPINFCRLTIFKVSTKMNITLCNHLPKLPP